MWSELPEVMNSGILNNISLEARKLHEAMFEVITSEASYLKSLNILMKHFAQSPKLSGNINNSSNNSSELNSPTNCSVISKWDHKRLFGDVINVRQCSERFLEDLEKKWQASVLLGTIHILRKHFYSTKLISRSAHTNNQYESRIFTTKFLFIYFLSFLPGKVKEVHVRFLQ